MLENLGEAEPVPAGLCDLIHARESGPTQFLPPVNLAMSTGNSVPARRTRGGRCGHERQATATSAGEGWLTDAFEQEQEQEQQQQPPEQH